MNLYIIIFKHLAEHPVSTNEIFIKHVLICLSFCPKQLSAIHECVCHTERQAADGRHLVGELGISTAILKVFYIRSVVSLKTGQQRLPKRDIHRCNIVLPLSFSSTPHFLKPSSICLRHFHRPPVTFTFPSIFPSKTCFARQFPRKMWSIQVTLLLFNVCIVFIPFLIPCNNSLFFTRSVQRICLILLQYHTSKLSTYFCSTFRRKNRPLEEYLAYSYSLFLEIYIAQ